MLARPLASLAIKATVANNSGSGTGSSFIHFARLFRLTSAHSTQASSPETLLRFTWVQRLWIESGHRQDAGKASRPKGGEPSGARA